MLDATEGTSRTEQAISHPGIVYNIRTISIQNFRVACSKWEHDMAKNVEKRFFSLALRNIK